MSNGIGMIGMGGLAKYARYVRPRRPREYYNPDLRPDLAISVKRYKQMVADNAKIRGGKTAPGTFKRKKAKINPDQWVKKGK